MTSAFTGQIKTKARPLAGFELATFCSLHATLTSKAFNSGTNTILQTEGYSPCRRNLVPNYYSSS